MTRCVQHKPSNLQLPQAVAEVYEGYPKDIRQKTLNLRQLIIETANEISIDELQETLKWGEPSYLTPKGSTLRIAWRKSSPMHYGLFFHCKTKLVETFKEVYHDSFTFEGNGAIIFKYNDVIPSTALKHCIELSLRYHHIKHLPLLGI